MATCCIEAFGSGIIGSDWSFCTIIERYDSQEKKQQHLQVPDVYGARLVAHHHLLLVGVQAGAGHRGVRLEDSLWKA